MLNFQQNKFNRIIPGLYDTNIVTIIGISHVYFGLYLALAILIITTATINGKIFYFKNKWIQVIIGVCLLLFLILLGAKMAIIAIFLILLINLASYIIRSGRYILAIVCCLLLGCFFYLTISIFPVTKERFEALSNQENYQIGDNQWNSIASRISILYCTKAVLKQNWLLGVGIGDAQHELNECFTSNKFGTLINMNAHNQFLQYILTSGITAFIAFTLCFLYPFVKFFRLRKANYLYIDFLLLFAFCCLTESMLESNKGIVFYSYFNSLLFLHVKKLQEEENSASLNR
ncbi:O-antigen ligase family protein [Rhodocytophaga aerolata]